VSGPMSDSTYFHVRCSPDSWCPCWPRAGPLRHESPGRRSFLNRSAADDVLVHLIGPSSRWATGNLPMQLFRDVCLGAALRDAFFQAADPPASHATHKENWATDATCFHGFSLGSPRFDCGNGKRPSPVDNAATPKSNVTLTLIPLANEFLDGGSLQRRRTLIKTFAGSGWPHSRRASCIVPCVSCARWE